MVEVKNFDFAAAADKVKNEKTLPMKNLLPQIFLIRIKSKLKERKIRVLFNRDQPY